MTEHSGEMQETGDLTEGATTPHAKVAVVVLAAGGSTRFGSAKQGARVDGMALAERALRAALGSGAEPVILVTGAHAETTLDAAGALPSEEYGRLLVVHNPDWAEGQASSVRAGVAALDASVGAAIFMPVDQPFLGSETLRQMVEAWRAGAAIVAPSVEGEIRGAPALFDHVYFGELAALEGDRGGRMLLQRHARAVTTIDVAAAQLLDVDIPDDLPASKA